jgi:GNAT superfamily N-acetyltransferase
VQSTTAAEAFVRLYVDSSVRRRGVGRALASRGGVLVGFTEAQVPAAGDAQQHDTAVLANWRGHGIATWLKADMLAWLSADRPP